MKCGRALRPQGRHPLFDLADRARQRGREHLGAGGGDQDVVLDAHADPAVLLGHGEVVGLEVEAGLDGEDVTLLQLAVVALVARVGAVVHVQAEHVADSVQRVAPVQLAITPQRLLGVGLEDPEVGQPVREDDHRRLVGRHEGHARFYRIDAGALGVEDQLVDAPLRR